MQSSKFNRRPVRRNLTQINTTTTQKFVKVGPEVPERYSSVQGHYHSENSNQSLHSSEAQNEGLREQKTGADELNYYMSKEHLTKRNPNSRNYRPRRESDSPESYSSAGRYNTPDESERKYRERSPNVESGHSVSERRYHDLHQSRSESPDEISKKEHERRESHHHSFERSRERSHQHHFSREQSTSSRQSHYWRGSFKEHIGSNSRNKGQKSRSPEYSRSSYNETVRAESEGRPSERGGGALLFADGSHVSTADERHLSTSTHDRHSGAVLLEDGSNVTYGDVRQSSHEMELGELEHVSGDSDIDDGHERKVRNYAYSHRSDKYQYDRDEEYERQSLNSRHDTRSSSRANEYSVAEYEHSYVSDVTRSEHSKRRLSPVSVGTLSSIGSKYRRNLSPVSHEDLTIHISERGRWIEGGHHHDDDVLDRVDSERYKRHFLGGKVLIKNDRHEDLDREMVSDDESYIDDHVDKFRSYLETGRESRRSDKEMFDDRYHSGSSHTYERVHSPESTVRERQLKSFEMGLNIPDLCPHYNKNKNIDHGCLNAQCKALHVCKAMVLESCRFGPKCKKSHDFTGQSRKILMKLNPGINLESRETYWKICMILQKKILIDCGREDLLGVIDEKFADRLRALEEARADESEKSPVPQPSTSSGFASSVRSGYKNSNSRDEGIGRKYGNDEMKETVCRSDKQCYKEKHDRTSGVQTVRRNSVESNTNSVNIEYDKNHIDQGPSKDNTEPLSPVSGDESNWEEYDKYDKVSDDGMPGVTEKQQDFESVSSSDADCEINSQTGKSFGLSAPVPMPENIAVPIGMNEPLVFNRPLGNKQTYIGPLNRPPPMVPLNPMATSQPPMFPVREPLLAGPNTRLHVPVGGPMMPSMGFPPNVAPMGVRPPFVSHLPSQNFMKQVIQQLPPVQFQSPPKNTFKNENTPAVFEAIVPKAVKKKKSAEKDHEFKETIKSLWTFPNKSVVNMSIIEFVTETEAFKEEFVAEILRILVTLELPYVTVKKLMSVIKEKILINIKTPADMRKILEMYPMHFRIFETVESDDESDEESARKSVKIKANVNLGFCDKHGFLPFAVGKCECNSLHVCKFYMLSNCPQKSCKFGHKLKTEHNISVLKNYKLHRLTGEEIVKYMSDVDNRNKETIPPICKYYTREKGCYKGDNTEYDSICHSLHLCIFKVRGSCTNKECEKSHSIRDIQPHSLLVKYGLDPDDLGDEDVLKMIRDANLEQENSKKNVKSQLSETGVPQKAGGVLIFEKSKPSGSASGSKLVKRGSEFDEKEKEIKKKISDLEKRDFNIPAVCKFYQNEMGCRRKDWGSDGKCHFLHLCQYFVIGECKFGESCKRSHDLYSGPTAHTLRKYNIDPDVFSKEEILELLSKSSDKPVALPTDESNTSVKTTQEKMSTSLDDKVVDQSDMYENKKVVEKEKGKKSMDEIMTERVPLHKQLQGVTQGLPGQGAGKQAPAKKTGSQFVVAAEGSKKRYDMKPANFQSCNIEDMIKNVIQEKKVDLSKVNDRCYGQETESKPGGQKH